MKKTKMTHRVEFWRGKLTRKWNWHIVCKQNGEIIAFSNQTHSRKIDAHSAFLNFLASAKAGLVEIAG